MGLRGQEKQAATTEPTAILPCIFSPCFIKDSLIDFRVEPPRRVRAVEEGLPLIRAAYTGISAIVDPYGRILQQRPLNDAGAIDTRLPRDIAAPPYAIWGDLPFGVILLLSIVILFVVPGNNRKPKEP